MFAKKEETVFPKLFPVVLCATTNPLRKIEVEYSPTHGASVTFQGSDPLTKLGKDELKRLVASL